MLLLFIYFFFQCLNFPSIYGLNYVAWSILLGFPSPFLYHIYCFLTFLNRFFLFFPFLSPLPFPLLDFFYFSFSFFPFYHLCYFFSLLSCFILYFSLWFFYHYSFLIALASDFPFLSHSPLYHLPLPVSPLLISLSLFRISSSLLSFIFSPLLLFFPFPFPLHNSPITDYHYHHIF